MNWLDWFLLAGNAVLYALGHYHGNNRGIAKATTALQPLQQVLDAQQTEDDQNAASGPAAGAAAYAAGKNPKH